MGELVTDRYDPWGIPPDAIVVLYWDGGLRPTPWQYLCMGSGFAQVSDVAEALKDQYPDMLDGKTVLVAQVGGNKSRVKQFRIATTVNRTVDESDPVAS